MANPWDLLPFPRQGDRSPNVTFRYVGLVVTSWESVEFELARLYSVFAGDPDGLAIQEIYGAGRIFRERLATLRRSFDKYRISNPCQYREGEFDRLTAAAEGFSDRRHEIAHGTVLRVDFITHFRTKFEPWYGDKPQFLLVPSYYTRRFHDKGLPKYAYSSTEMNELSARLLELSRMLRDLRLAYLG